LGFAKNRKIVIVYFTAGEKDKEENNQTNLDQNMNITYMKLGLIAVAQLTNKTKVIDTRIPFEFNAIDNINGTRIAITINGSATTDITTSNDTTPSNQSLVSTSTSILRNPESENKVFKLLSSLFVLVPAGAIAGLIVLLSAIIAITNCIRNL